MKSVIKEIFFGERGHFETIKPSEEYWKVFEDYGKFYEELEKGLTEKQNKILQELYIAAGGLQAEAELTHFKEGFKLGLLVAIEAFVQ